MPDHPHTIDRWDDATGENLIEQIAAVAWLNGVITVPLRSMWPTMALPNVLLVQLLQVRFMFASRCRAG